MEQRTLVPELLDSVDAVLGFRGLLVNCSSALRTTAFILNLSASTSLQMPTLKTKIGSVRNAVLLGAEGVCFQIHISDANEHLMLRDLGAVIDEASDLGIPVLVTAYPRRMGATGIENYHELQRSSADAYLRLVCHTVRVAVELGADIVKTVYTGGRESFSTVVESALGVPVLAAGGPVVATEFALTNANDAMVAGAWGLAYGRQIFLNQDPIGMARKLRQILDAHERA